MSPVASAFASGARNLWLLRNRHGFRDQARSERARLLVDVSVVFRHDAQTGIQRVVRAFWTHLLHRSGRTFEVVPVFATRRHGYRYAEPGFLDCDVAARRAGGTVRMRAGDKFLGLDLSAHLLPMYASQVEAWRRAGASVHLIVYDLLPIRRPDWFNRSTVENFSRWIEIVRLHCDQAICISAQVAKDLQDYLGPPMPRPRIDQVGLGGDIEGSCPSLGIQPAVAAAIRAVKQRRSILMVGTIEPRKGYDVGLAAFEYLWQADPERAPSLVIVGKPGWRTEDLQERLRTHPELNRRLFWLTNASDEGLSALYEACDAVFLASHAEGFGLPGIEAAMHGRYALVRDLPVFREQCLSNLRFFSEDSPGALAASLTDLLALATKPPAVSTIPCWDDQVTVLVDRLGLRTKDDEGGNSSSKLAAGCR